MTKCSPERNKSTRRLTGCEGGPGGRSRPPCRQTGAVLIFPHHRWAPGRSVAWSLLLHDKHGAESEPPVTEGSGDLACPTDRHARPGDQGDLWASLPLHVLQHRVLQRAACTASCEGAGEALRCTGPACALFRTLLLEGKDQHQDHDPSWQPGTTIHLGALFSLHLVSF